MAKLTIVGPNLPDQSKGSIHVHAAECKDLTRGQYRNVPAHEKYTEEHTSLRSVVESFYGPDAGSFYEEAYGDDIPPDVWKEYLGEFWFAPCVDDLPDDTEPDDEFDEEPEPEPEPEPVECDVHPGSPHVTASLACELFMAERLIEDRN